jgi:hypothetical protein
MRGLAAPEYRNNIAFQNGYNNDIIATLNSKFPQAVEQTKNVKFSGSNLTEKGRAIWNYLKNSVQYRKDDRGKQVIQLPSRMLLDTKKGDCKSLALAAASFMQANGFKNVRLRYTSYSKTDKTPTHVYSVGADDNGNDIIIDPVYKQFNKELSYTFKQDYPMQISVLSGINQPKVIKVTGGSRQLNILKKKDPVELAKKLLASGKVKPGGFFYNILLNYISRRSGKVNYPSYTAEQLQRYRAALNKLAPKNLFLASLLEEEKQLLDRGTFVGNIITKYSSAEINGVNEEIGKLSLKKIKKGLKKISIKNIVKGVKTVGLVAPRKAFLALVALNVRGLATRMSKLSTSDLDSLWVKKFGGKLSVLQGAIAKGKKKKPLFGASKKVKSIKGIGYVVSDMDTIGAEPATGATTATIIAAASPILIAVISLLKKKKVDVPELVTAAAASAGALAENSDFAEANPAAAEAISKYSDYAQKAVNTAEKLGIIPDKPESPAETAVNKAIPEDDHTETAGTTMGTGFKLNPLILVGAAAGAYFLFGRKK